MGDIKVDNQSDVVNIDTTGNDIRSNQNIDSSGFKFVHDHFTLCLFKIRMHFSYIQFHHFQSLCYFFNLDFGGSENNHTFGYFVSKKAAYDT